MSNNMAVLLTLIAYQVALLGLGLWARTRTHDSSDFILGGRTLGASVAALSASASSSSAWSLLGVSGAAFAWGLPAIWLLPATMLGFVINWCWVAPRLMKASRNDGSLTLISFLADNVQGRLRIPIRRFGAIIVVFSFVFYVAAQFQAAGTAFSSSLGMESNDAMIVGAAVVLAYVLLGGFWAVSITDALQGLLMALTSILLPLVCILSVDGSVVYQDLMGPNSTWVTGAGLAGVGFVVGLLGIGLGYPGQPHVVNRFMALKDERSLRHGRIIALSWAAVLYCGMLITGWYARSVLGAIDNTESALLEVSQQLLPPVIAGVMTAAVLSAIMSTADSQLHVAGAAVSHDFSRDSDASLSRTRQTVAGVTIVALVLALFAPQDIFSRVLFAWHALGSALGPALVLRLCGRQIAGPWLLASMVAGFALTVIAHLLPNTPGDIAERYVPLLVALALAAYGSFKSKA